MNLPQIEPDGDDPIERQGKRYTQIIAEISPRNYHEGHLPPIVLVILMHVYAIAEPLESSGYPPSIARTLSLTCLMRYGLIERDGEEPCGYRCTERGEAHVKALGALRFPPAGA